MFGNYLVIALCESLVGYHFQDDGGVCLVTEKIWERGEIISFEHLSGKPMMTNGLNGLPSSSSMDLKVIAQP